MKIAAMIILYNPPEDFLSNIFSFYENADIIFVYDNSETNISLEDKFKGLSKIKYYRENQNKGIAARLNEGCKKAIAEGFEWLLTMDQDSKFMNKDFKTYLNYISNFPAKDKTALFGTGYSRKSENCINRNYENVDDIITSGMILNLKIFKHIGAFDENLFIDSVDHDYCIRAKLMNYQLIKFNNISMMHQLGLSVNAASFKSLFLFKKKKIIHSPQRCYYMVRNLLYLNEKYKNTKNTLLENLKKNTPVSIKKSMLYGRESLAVKKYIAKAKHDFQNKRMGRITE